MNVRQIILQFIKAQASAIVATCVDFGVTILLAQCFGLYYVYATVTGAVCGGVTNCIVNYKYVFADAHQHKWCVAVKYLVVWIGSIILNSYGTYALTELMQMHFFYPKVIVAVVVAVVWNYLLQRNFVYRNCHIIK